MLWHWQQTFVTHKFSTLRWNAAAAMLSSLIDAWLRASKSAPRCINTYWSRLVDYCRNRWFVPQPRWWFWERLKKISVSRQNVHNKTEPTDDETCGPTNAKYCKKKNWAKGVLEKRAKVSSRFISNSMNLCTIDFRRNTEFCPLQWGTCNRRSLLVPNQSASKNKWQCEVRLPP